MADYEKFVQKHGPRKGQKYVIKNGDSGKKIRVYENGDTALVTHQPSTNPYKSPMAQRGLSSQPNPFSSPAARRRFGR